MLQTQTKLGTIQLETLAAVFAGKQTTKDINAFITENSGQTIPDGSLRRTLKDLKAKGFIDTNKEKSQRCNVHTLTPTGKDVCFQQVQELQSIFTAALDSKETAKSTPTAPPTYTEIKNSNPCQVQQLQRSNVLEQALAPHRQYVVLNKQVGGFTCKTIYGQPRKWFNNLFDHAFGRNPSTRSAHFYFDNASKTWVQVTKNGETITPENMDTFNRQLLRMATC